MAAKTIMVAVVVIQRLSLSGCTINAAAKQSFVIIGRSQCVAGGGNVGNGSPGKFRASFVYKTKDIPAASVRRGYSP
jgi:hypothetical protein